MFLALPFGRGDGLRQIPEGDFHFISRDRAAFGTGARADEEKVPLDKLTKAVGEAVKAEFSKAEIKEATRTDRSARRVKSGSGEEELSVTVV